MKLDRSFDADYDVEPLIDMPPTLDYDFHEPGGTSTPDLLLHVTTGDGTSWTGGVRAGGPSVGSPNTGIYATPNKKRLLVLARGDPYLIDVQNPSDYEALFAGGPVVVVKPIPVENVLLFATPWDVTAIGPDGVLWTTDRLAIDGLRLDESQDGRVAGVADPKDLEPRDFVIDLRTGKHEGGVPVHMMLGTPSEFAPPVSPLESNSRAGSGSPTGRDARAITPVDFLGTANMGSVRLPAPLMEILDILRRAYPDGFPKIDYFPLLAVLQTDMGEENLSRVVAEFLDDETVVIANDAAKAASVAIPRREDIRRVRSRLEAAGWEPEIEEEES